MSTSESDRDDHEAQEPFLPFDRPIETAKDDKLGRASFARGIAKAIRRWRGQDSFIVAVCGDWGLGKTSIKNLITEELRKGDPAPAANILDFNPWQFAGQTNLRTAFFDEVGRVLGRSKDEDATQTAKKWKTYATALKVVHPLLDKLPETVRALYLLLASGGMAFVAILRTPGWVRVLGVGMVLLAAIAEAVSEFVEKRVVEFLEARAAAKKEKTVKELKDELGAILAERARPLVVFIDDIDRLESSDIRAIFQLVKADCDLPSLVYVLLFQRDIVEKAVGASPDEGHAFLEKVIQMPFDVPVLERERLEIILSGGLDVLLASPAVKKHFDNERFLVLYRKGLDRYFQSLRDVYRFLGSLHVNFDIFSEADSCEVNPVDVLAMEVLRVFEPTFFGGIGRSRSLFFDEPWVDVDRQQKRRKAEFQALLQVVKEERRDAAADLLVALFPFASEPLGKGGVARDREREQRELRVSIPNFFDRYFNATVPIGDISQYTLDGILDSMGDEDKLRTRLLDLDGRQLLASAVRRLDPYRHHITSSNLETVATVLFDLGDRLPLGRGRFLRMLEPTTYAGRLILGSLLNEKDMTRREDTIRRALDKTDGLRLPKWLLTIDRAEDQVFETAALDRLRALWVEKVRAAAKAGTLVSRCGGGIPGAWAAWGSRPEVEVWFKELMGDTAGGAARVIAPFESSVETLADGISTQTRFIDLESLEGFVSVDDIKARLRRAERLSQEEERLRELFFQTIATREKELRVMPLAYLVGTGSAG